MTFETFKIICTKTEKCCRVFKDNRIKNIIIIAFSFDEKKTINSIDIEMYIQGRIRIKSTIDNSVDKE